MRHAIQTNFRNIREASNELDQLFGDYTETRGACSVGFDRVVIVFVKGNGAVLRDVVTALDKAGHLD